jgi:hypothetical protein
MLRSIRFKRPGQKPPLPNRSRTYRRKPRYQKAALLERKRDCSGPLLDRLRVQPAGPVRGPHQRS